MTPEPTSASAPNEGEWVSARPSRALEVLARLVNLPRLVARNSDLVTTTLKRDLAARFQGTLLGWAWPFLQPLFLFAVYYFIFTEFLQIKMQNLPEEQQAGMGVYMFAGMICWAALGESLARGTGVIVDNGNLIKKLAFPSEILPLNVVLAALSLLLFATTAFVLATLVTPIWPRPGAHLLWLPVILFLQGLFTYGLVLGLSTLQVFLRDTVQIVGMVTTVWMFATPIFWAPEAMSGPIREHMDLLAANPIYHLVGAWRGALMGDVFIQETEGIAGGAAVSVAAIPAHLLTFGAWAVGAYVLGYAFFVMAQRRFADEV
jgi:ABC-type polysaccharide/polyol phosphate export permease